MEWAWDVGDNMSELQKPHMEQMRQDSNKSTLLFFFIWNSGQAKTTYVD